MLFLSSSAMLIEVVGESLPLRLVVHLFVQEEKHDFPQYGRTAVPIVVIAISSSSEP